MALVLCRPPMHLVCGSACKPRLILLPAASLPLHAVCAHRCARAAERMVHRDNPRGDTPDVACAPFPHLRHCRE